MNLILERLDFIETGIFGSLTDENGELVAVTLEHAYPTTIAHGQTVPTFYAPKLPFGTYQCERGMHQLEHMAAPFETFEICDVPGHTDILFHIGNTNPDSSGCVLLGEERSGQFILESRNAFKAFMALQVGCNAFTLIVK